MHRILEDIIYRTKKDLLKRKEKESLHDLKSSIIPQEERSFIQAIKKSKTGSIAIIAEIKLASPSEDDLGNKNDIELRAEQYQQAGANAISIVTEKYFFNGDPIFVNKIKQITSLPILQKDFIVDPYQLYEAKRVGADAVLLIVRILSRTGLINLVNLAKEIGIEPVVEINNQDDLGLAIATHTKIIAINARDLDTFEINIDHACELIKQIPSQFITLGFSGVKGKEEAERYKNAGVDGILIGTSLMKTNNILEFIKEIRV